MESIELDSQNKTEIKGNPVTTGIVTGSESVVDKCLGKEKDRTKEKEFEIGTS